MEYTIEGITMNKSSLIFTLRRYKSRILLLTGLESRDTIYTGLEKE